MPDSKAYRLQDLPPFEALGAISEELGVEFTLYGGAATRVAMYLYYHPGYDFDLFDLTPFTSDVDIAHTGDKDKTLEIKQAINDRVPFANWCRWALLDKDEFAEATKNRMLSTAIPLRSLEFGTGFERAIPRDIKADLRNRRVTFRRSPEFSSASFAKEGRDLEIFGLLLVMNVRADLIEISGECDLEQDISKELRWLRDANSQEQLASTIGDPKLSARFWQLLANQIARLDSGASLMRDELLGIASRLKLMQGFNIDFDDALAGNQAISVSRMSQAGEFLVPELSPTVHTGATATKALGEQLSKLNLYVGESSPIAGFDKFTIDPAFELVGFVPEITIASSPTEEKRKDTRDESRDVYFSDSAQEFFQLAWVSGQDDCSGYEGKGLTASLLPWARKHSVEFLAPSAVGGAFKFGRNWARIDLASCIAKGDKPEDIPASLLIMRARNE